MANTPVDQVRIWREVRARRITRLCHFTRESSFEGVLRLGGLLSRNLLSGHNLDAVVNDDLRLDGALDYLSLSIQYPNTKLLYTFETRFRTPDWVVLLIDPRVIRRRSTKYCPVNAATGAGLSVGCGIGQFRSMFALQRLGDSLMRESGRSDACPTDLQAEVLVRDRVSLSSIRGVVTRNDDQMMRVVAAMGRHSRRLPVQVEQRMFSTHHVQHAASTNADLLASGRRRGDG